MTKSTVGEARRSFEIQRYTTLFESEAQCRSSRLYHCLFGAVEVGNGAGSRNS